MNGTLSSDLKKMGYERTETESPFEEGARLWTKGYEAVCEETGIVIRGDDEIAEGDSDDSKNVYRYRHSGNVKMPGGYVGSYHWGTDESGFFY